MHSSRGLNLVARLGSALLAIVMGLLATCRDKIRALLPRSTTRDDGDLFDMLFAEVEAAPSFHID